MPTRFYYSFNQTTPVSPAYSADWEKTTNAVRRYLVASKEIWPEALADRSDSENVATSPYDVLVAQFVSGRLAAQTISGTVKGQIRVRESNAAADFCRALVIKVVSGDGGTLRGVLLSHFPSSLTSEWATSLTNRYFPPPGTTLTAVNAQEGDRIVVEVGFRAFNTSTTSYTGYLNLGYTSGDDLPENETTTTALNPWLEFSQDLVFRVELGGLGAVVESAGLALGSLGAVVESADLALGSLGAVAVSERLMLGGLAVTVMSAPLWGTNIPVGSRQREGWWGRGGWSEKDTNIVFQAPASVRLTTTSAVQPFMGYRRLLAVQPGNTYTVQLRVRKSTTIDGEAYNGTQPRLVVLPHPALNLTQPLTLATMTAANGVWEVLSGTLPSPVGTGVVTLGVEFTALSGFVNIEEVF